MSTIRRQLQDILDHWKDGTRPGDDPITSADVAQAVESLIDARVSMLLPGPAPVAPLKEMVITFDDRGEDDDETES